MLEVSGNPFLKRIPGSNSVVIRGRTACFLCSIGVQSSLWLGLGSWVGFLQGLARAALEYASILGCSRFHAVQEARGPPNHYSYSIAPAISPPPNGFPGMCGIATTYQRSFSTKKTLKGGRSDGPSRGRKKNDSL